MASSTWSSLGSGPLTEARGPGEPARGFGDSGRGQARTKTETTPEDRGGVPRGDPASPTHDEGEHRGPVEGRTEIRTGPSETRGKDRTGTTEDQSPHETLVRTQRVIPRR